jgi:O-antigen/teichoic acid export membrane protein
MSSLKKNIFKNSVASLIQKLAKVLDQLLLVPFFISAWGVAYYGEWLTLTIIPSMLAFSDFGFGTAVANSFVLKYVSGAKEKAADIFKTGFVIISITIVFGMLLSGIVLYVLNNFEVFEKSLIEKSDAMWAVSVLILSRFINFYNQLFGACFTAARKASLAINLMTVLSFFNICGGLIILLLGYGVVEYAISQLVVICVFNVFYAFKSISVLGLVKEFKGQFKREYVRQITQTGLGYLMSPIWQSIYFQGTTFVVRVVIGPEAVALFNTVRTLSRTVNQFFSLVSSSVFPEFQYEFGQGNLEKAHKLFRMAISTAFFVAVIGALFLSLFGLWFYEIWTNNELQVPIVMWNIFVVGVLFNSLWWSSSMVFSALNKPYFLSVAGVFSAVISVVVSYFLGKTFGLNGIALGSLLLDVLMVFLILPRACKLIGITLNKDLLQKSFRDFKDVYKMYKHKIIK